MDHPCAKMPWLLQLLTGRSSSPQKTASDHRHQKDDSDSDSCNNISNWNYKHVVSTIAINYSQN